MASWPDRPGPLVEIFKFAVRLKNTLGFFCPLTYLERFRSGPSLPLDVAGRRGQRTGWCDTGSTTDSSSEAVVVSLSDSSHLRLADRSCMASWTRSETTLRLDRQGPAAGALQSARKHRRSGCLLSVGSKAPSFRLPLPRTFETYCRDGRRPRPLAGWRRAGTLLSRCCLIRLYRVHAVNRRAVTVHRRAGCDARRGPMERRGLQRKLTHKVQGRVAALPLRREEPGELE